MVCFILILLFQDSESLAETSFSEESEEMSHNLVSLSFYTNSCPHTVLIHKPIPKIVHIKLI